MFLFVQVKKEDSDSDESDSSDSESSDSESSDSDSDDDSSSGSSSSDDDSDSSSDDSDSSSDDSDDDENIKKENGVEVRIEGGNRAVGSLIMCHLFYLFCQHPHLCPIVNQIIRLKLNCTLLFFHLCTISAYFYIFSSFSTCIMQSRIH